MNGNAKPGANVQPVKATAKPSAAARLRQEMPSMRAAFLWSEILGKPLAMRGRR